MTTQQAVKTPRPSLFLLAEQPGTPYPPHFPSSPMKTIRLHAKNAKSTPF